MSRIGLVAATHTVGYIRMTEAVAMAYREVRRYCKVCGRVTDHWADWKEWRQAPPPEAWQIPFVALFRLVRKTISGCWRCLECDHPWNTSLLKNVSGSGR